MTKFALLGAAALLSLTAATPSIAQGVYNPGYCAVLSEHQLPEQGTEQSLYRRLSAPAGLARRLCLRRRSVHGGRGVLYRPRWPPHLLLLSNLESSAAGTGGREVTRWRFPFP
jgi:hypothetical protein